MVALGRRRLHDGSKVVEEAVRGMERVHGLKLLLNFTPAIRLEECLSAARGMVRNGAEILFIDYLTLIRYEDKQMSRPERVGEVSKSLKWLAREMDIPVVVLSQLNRDSENRTPTLDKLRQTGELEEDSDVVLLIDRQRDKEQTKLIIAKNRNGPLGAVELRFNPERACFNEVDRRDEE